MEDQFDQDDPFKKYGGQQIQEQDDPNDPFKKYGGKTIAQPQPSKKKDSPFPSPNSYLSGGIAGIGNGTTPSDPKKTWVDRMLDLAKSRLKLKEQPEDNLLADVDLNDPVKSITAPIKSDVDKFQTELNVLNQNEYYRSGESTKIQTPGTRLSFDKRGSDFAKVKNAASYSANKLATTERVLYESVFPDGVQAKIFLSNRQKNNGSLDPNNETEKLAQRKAADFDKVASDVKNFGSITMAARADKVDNNPNFKKQLEQLHSEGLNVPPALEASITAEYLYKHGNDLRALAEQNPEVKDDFDDLANNLLTKYPDYGISVVANKVSRERQARGLNNNWANFQWGKFESNTDKIAEEILTPQEKKIYDENIRDNKKKYIDVPGFFNRFEESVERSAGHTKNFMSDLLGTESTGNTIYGELEKQATHVSADEKGWAKTLGTAGDWGGIIAYMGAGGNILRGGGVPASVGSKTMAGLTFYDDFYKQAKLKYPDDPLKQKVSTIGNTIFLMSLSHALPSAQVSKAFDKMKPGINRVINTLDGVPPATAKETLMNVFKDGLANYSKGVAEMGAFTLADQALDKALGMSDDTFIQYHPENQLLDAIKGAAIGLVAPTALTGIAKYRGERQMNGNIVYEVATNKKRFSSSIMESDIPERQKEQILSTIDYLSALKGDLDVREIPEAKQKEFLLKAVKEISLQKQLGGTPDSNLRRPIENELKKIQDEKEEILKAAPPKTNEPVSGKETDELLSELKNKASDTEQQADIDYFIDKAAEDPKAFEERFGKENSEKVLELVSDERLQQSHDTAIELGLIEAADSIAKELDKREAKQQGMPEEISEPIELDPTLPEGYELPKKESDFNLTERANEQKPEQTNTERVEQVSTEESRRIEEPPIESGERAGEPPVPPEPPKEEPISGDEGAGKKELDKLANNVPDSGKVAEYMSKDTIEKYTGETPTNDQRRGVQELEIALNHGEKIIEKAKEVFGNDYVEKTLDYIDNSTASVSNKALMYVSLENALGREKLQNPDRAADLAKQQALVYAKSQAFARENSLALNYQKLRRIATEGYDISKVTDSFFSSKELENKAEIEKAVEASPEQINEEAQRMEVGGIDPLIEQKIREGVQKEVDKLYEALPKEKKTAADKAISALEAIQKKIRGKTYDATIGVPLAIIDAGITVIKNAIKAGVKVADAIELGISKIKELHGKDWAKENDFRKDLTEGFKEQGIEAKRESKERKKEYRKLESERNRQLKIINDLTDKLKELESGNRPDSKKQQSKEDVPEIIELRKKVSEERKKLDKLEAEQRRVEKLEDELQRLRDKLPEDKKNTKTKEISDREKELKQLIGEEKKTNREYVKNALIQQGFGREITVKEKNDNGETVEVTKQVLDWKKLAGEAGTVSKISENVGKVLEKDGFTAAQLENIKEDFVQQYVDLRASVIEKALNELARRNKTSVTPKQKGAAKRLAELYTYGLFEQRADEFQNVVNTALGAGVSAEGFAQAKEIAKAMQSIFNNSFKGIRLDEMSAKSAIDKLDERIRVLMDSEIKKQGNGNLKVANIIRNYFEIQQTMLLQNMKQVVENPFSGLQQNLMDKLGANINKTSTPELANQRRKLMKDVYADMVLNKGVGYGKVESQFVNRKHIDDYINKMSDNQVYHTVMSAATGKATLHAMDAMYKAGLTERKFTNNLVKILTSDTNPNKMSKEDAVKFVSEQLTGANFKEAQQTAEQIIDKINADAGHTLIEKHKTVIDRFANDIVKASLEMGGKVTKEQIEAAYNAAYRAAGLGLGHEANNPLSSMVKGRSAQLEANVNRELKEKNWNAAAAETYESILFRNVMNPFVGGGTNWLVLKLEKAGLGLFTGLYYRLKDGKNMRIDVGSDIGMKNLEKALYQQSRVKDNFMRGVIGGSITLSAYLAFLGIASTKQYEEWKEKNPWAARYLDIITPEWILVDMASDDPKQFKKYLSNTLNKNDAFDAGKKLIKSGEYFAKGDKSKGFGAFGEALGSKLNAPVPWRLVKDVQVVYQGVKGEDPYHGNYKPSEGFLSGVTQGGVIEWLGYRPIGMTDEEKRIAKLPKFIQDDYKRTEQSAFIPSKVSNTLTIEGNEVKLSDDDKEKYSTLVDNNRNELIEKLLNTDAGKKMYAKLPDEARKQLLSQIYDAGRELAKQQFLSENKNVTEEAKKMMKERVDTIKQQIEERTPKP